MDKKKDKKKAKQVKETDVKLKVFTGGDEDFEFIPWGEGKKGRQSFITIEKEGARGLLYTGEGPVMEAEVNKASLKLINEGWKKIGELEVEFDGRSKQEKEIDELFARDHVRLEVGKNLLPLLDPNAGAPLLDLTSALRKDIVKETGVVIPGIRVMDNMSIPFENYIIYVKETPVASGELYLDRFLAIGSLEQLSDLKGWSTKDPSFNSPAKWIEKDEQAKADQKGCLVMGTLNVLVTHLKETLMSNLTSMLGLQEVKHFLDRLNETHPVVVEDFLKDKKKLRNVRKILHGLVAERVSIRDLVTIMEIIGDNEEKLDSVNFMIEQVRMALGRQICWQYLGMEGKITALALSRKMETKIQSNIKQTKHGLRLTLDADEAGAMLKYLKKAMEDYQNPPVIFTDPPTRQFFRRLVERAFPNVGVLSTAEIGPGIPIEIVGEIDLPPEVMPAKPSDEKAGEGPEGEDKEKKQGGLFSFMKS